jgi:D-alanine--poly(phosphoribitol) ligase subunit 1
MKFDFVKSQFIEGNIDPENPAVIGTDRTLSWRELALEVDAIAKSIAQQGSSPIIIYGHKEAGMVSALLACFKLQIPYVPVDTIVPAARVQNMAEISQSSLVLCTADQRVEGKSNLHLPSFEWSGPKVQSHKWSGADDLAYIIFTSGSSGEPKGVQIRRENVKDLSDWVASDDFGFTAQDTVLNQCSYSFDVSFFDTIAALQVGGCLALNSPSDVKSPNAFADRLNGKSATAWSSTPSFLSLSLTHPKFDEAHFPSLKRFYVAGEVVHKSLAQRLWRRFPTGELWNAYGPTEATVITTLVNVNQEILSKYPTVPIGRVKPGVTMPTSAQDGVSEGELWIIGNNVSPGYLNRPDLNESRFAIKNGKRGYLTGDVGFHQDGLIFYKGRIDSQIKLHGYRIELDEIDKHVMDLPFVEGAATVGLRRDGDIKKLICFIKCKGEEPKDIVDQIKSHLAKTLPYYMIPSDFKVIKELPYSTSHKVNREALLREFQESMS